MNDTSTILVPFNFSKTSERALDYAIHYVGNSKDLRILLAYNAKNQDKDGLTKAFEKTEAKYQGLLEHKLKWVAVSGTLTEFLVKTRETEHVDLIIMGTFGTLGTDDDEPTNTSKLVLEIDCPVLVVPYGFEKFRIMNIALVLGKEEIEDAGMLAKLLKIVRKFDAKVHVLTIENKPESYGYSETDEKNENMIQYYLESFYSEHTFIKNPDVLEGIKSYVSDKNIDLIAILPRNHAKRSTPSEGALTESLTLHSQVPVLALD